MGTLNRHNHRHVVLLAPVAAFVLLLLLLFSLFSASPVSADDSVKIVGVVTGAPVTVNGSGVWNIKDDGGTVHSVQAGDDTEFGDGIPKIGDRVEAETILAEPNPLVERMKILEIGGDGGDDDGGDDGTTDDDSDEVEGQVLVKPQETGGIGEWIIQTELNLTETVIASATTRFDKGIPDLGDWVEVDGVRRQNGVFEADRIRPDEYEDGELIVWLKPGVLSSTIEARYNLEAKSTVLGGANIYLFSTEDDDEPNLVEIIQADPDIVSAELNFVQSTIEDGYSTWSWGGADPGDVTEQQAFAQVNFSADALRYDGTGIVVAVLDTGVDYAHPALTPQLLSGLDVVADDLDPTDDGRGQAWGHGTHVAGVIASIAPNARILPIRVLDTNGRGNTFILAYAISWAVDQEVDVINLSLGATSDSEILRDMVKKAVDSGIVVVAAAGNQNQETLRYPAAYDGVLPVAALDGTGHKAGFSNFGSWIKLAAPGVGITSTVIGPQGRGFASWSGTSMAAPFVAGAAALARQGYPADDGTGIKARLIAAATDLDAANPSYAGKLGGLLNVGGLFSSEQPLYLPFVRN